MLSLSVIILYPAKEASLKNIVRFLSTRANDVLSLANQPFRKSHHFLYVRALIVRDETKFWTHCLLPFSECFQV